MAVVKSMNFTRGRLGDIGFRQQYVRDGANGYKRRTVAFQIPETVTNPNTPGQVRQRTRFRLVQGLGAALARKSILYNFYQSPAGISGYNAFVRDNLAFAVVGNDGGDIYVDFRKLQVTNGDFSKKVQAYQSELKTDDCHVAKKLAWDYDWTCDPAGNYALNMIGIKIDESGAVEDIICVQPRTAMHACVADVELPSCDCCKTYWYAYFVDPFSGYFSTANYIGTSHSELPTFADNCYTCNLPAQLVVNNVLPPEENPEFCGDQEIDTGAIVFTGSSRVSGNTALGGGIIFGACPLYDWQVMTNETGDGLVIDILNSEEIKNIMILDQDGTELYSGTDNHLEITSLSPMPTSIKAIILSSDERCNKELMYELGEAEEPINNLPRVEFLSIADGDTVEAANIKFQVSASDIEDGDLTDEVVVTSDIDGVVVPNTEGQWPLSVGTHTLTASVTDSDGGVGTASIKVILV